MRTVATEGGHWEGAFVVSDGVKVAVFVEEIDGRRVATEVWIAAPGRGVTSSDLRALPLARLEADDPAHRHLGRLRARHAQQPDLAEIQARLRSSRSIAAPVPEQREPLGRPDGRDPEGFYSRVATAYRSAAAESSRPAVLLADENGVPVETVRRWIQEARRRSLLGPARKGRAG